MNLLNVSEEVHRCLNIGLKIEFEALLINFYPVIVPQHSKSNKLSLAYAALLKNTWRRTITKD